MGFRELLNRAKTKDERLFQGDWTAGTKNQGVKYTVVFCYPNEAMFRL